MATRGQTCPVPFLRTRLAEPLRKQPRGQIADVICCAHRSRMNASEFVGHGLSKMKKTNQAGRVALAALDWGFAAPIARRMNASEFVGHGLSKMNAPVGDAAVLTLIELATVAKWDVAVAAQLAQAGAHKKWLSWLRGKERGIAPDMMEAAALALRSLALAGNGQFLPLLAGKLPNVSTHIPRTVGAAPGDNEIGAACPNNQAYRKQVRPTQVHGRTASSRHRRLNGTDAVIGLAFGYPWEVHTRFLGSLRRTGYDGTIYMLTTATEQPEARHVMHCFGASQVHVNNPGAFVFLVKARAMAATQCFLGHHERCLITDVRDVFFQHSPFVRYPAGAELLFTYEEPPPIREEPLNRKWLLECLSVDRTARQQTTGWFGSRWLARRDASTAGIPSALDATKPICSGTIMGTARGMHALARQLEAAEDDLPRCLTGALDQALINLLVHRAANEPLLAPHMSKIRIVVEERGAGGSINTIGKVLPLPRAEGGRGMVLESNGVPSVVVHQFDRHVGLRVYANRLGGLNQTHGANELVHEARQEEAQWRLRQTQARGLPGVLARATERAVGWLRRVTG